MLSACRVNSLIARTNYESFGVQLEAPSFLLDGWLAEGRSAYKNCTYIYMRS